MATRIISALIAIPILLFFVIKGGVTLQIGVLFISLIGLFEFYKAMLKEKTALQYIGYGFTILYCISLDYSNIKIIIFTLFILAVLICSVILHEAVNIIDACIIIVGFFYVTFMLSNIYLIRQMENGSVLIWPVFISAWGSDTGAYFFGVAFGKKKLVPTLSPGKTIVGAIGGIFISSLIGIIYALVIKYFFNDMLKFNIVFVSGLVCFFGSIFSQFGDLTASTIKRYTKIKDFGKIMPGHGGILDRFDSVLFTASIIYIILTIL